MKKHKSIKEVLKQGHLSINAPLPFLFIIVLSLSIYLSPLILPKAYIAIGMLFGLLLGFVFAWLWWSYKIVKWRIWAFANTKKTDWPRLKQKAISKKLIWEDGSIFEKTEIRSQKESQRIKEINLAIEQMDNKKATAKNTIVSEIQEDPNIPTKIDYFYNRTETILSAFLPIFITALGLATLYFDRPLLGILTIGMAFYYTDANKIKDAWKKDIQFSLSNEGIDIKQFKQFGFVKWENTEDISVDTEDGILALGVWEKEDFYEVSLNLKDYDIGDYEDFLRTINVYLKRSLKNK